MQQILEMTGGFGADYTFEATGLVKVMRQAVEAARMGWGLCTVAGVAGKGETLDVIPRLLITGRRIAGSSFGGVKGREQVPQYVERYLAGDIDVDAFLSHRIALDEVNRGFELMEAQDGIRSVIALHMIDHLKLFVADPAASRAFYEQALEPLGYRVMLEPAPGVVGMGADAPGLLDRAGRRPGRRSATSASASTPRSRSSAFHAAALAAGGTDNGPPGPRPHYHQNYYGAFVLDPDGNNVEAVYHGAMQPETARLGALLLAASARSPRRAGPGRACARSAACPP